MDQLKRNPFDDANDLIKSFDYELESMFQRKALDYKILGKKKDENKDSNFLDD